MKRLRSTMLVSHFKCYLRDKLDGHYLKNKIFSLRGVNLTNPGLAISRLYSYLEILQFQVENFQFH